MAERPGVVYLHGFTSSPASQKAVFFHERLRERGIDVVIPDLNGPDFRQLTISGALREAAAALEEAKIAERGAVLIGSSLGGYLAAILASRDPRIRAAILMAPAFDLPARWTAWLGEEGIANWRQSRELEVDHHATGEKATLGFGFYLDAMGHPPYPRPSCPTLILHGLHDESVGIGTSRKIAEGSPTIQLVELDSDHGLLDVRDRLWDETISFLERSLGSW